MRQIFVPLAADSLMVASASALTALTTRVSIAEQAIVDNKASADQGIKEAKEAAAAVAERTGSHLARVYGVMSFYHFFKTQRPGKNKISVCLGTACYLKGGQDLIDEARAILGLDADKISTDDGLFSVEPVRCIGCCGLAPVLSVNGDVYGKLTKSQIAGILDKYREA